jgi:hypothetical protein
VVGRGTYELAHVVLEGKNADGATGVETGAMMGCEEVMEGWLSRPERRRRRGERGSLG